MKIAVVGNNLTSNTLFPYLLSLKLDVDYITRSYTQKEQDLHKNKFSARTMALSGRSIDILSKFTDVDHVKNLGQRINKIKIFDNTDSILPNIIFESSIKQGIDMGYIIDYNKFSNFIIEQNLNLGSTKDVIEQDLYDLIIITDNSFDLDLNIQNEHIAKYDYKEYAITFNIEHEYEHNGTAIEWFTHNGPIASLPTKSEKTSNIVMTLPKHLLSNKEITNDLVYCIMQQFQLYLGNFHITSTISCFPLYLSLAKQPQDNKFIFLGSKRIIMHPIAGQGFNLILRDIERLVDCIQKSSISHFKQSIGNKIDVYSLLFATHSLNQLFKIQNPFITSVRKIGMHVVDNCNFIKNGFIKNASGFGIFND